MTGAEVGEDGVARCPWAGGPGLMRDYHDAEWGVRVHGESAYLERLTLEAFQSGLSWSTILRKREAFREAFRGFDADVVAAFDDDDRARLMADAGIVRNRLKVDAAITNARATVALREQEGLEAFVLSFAPADPPAWTDTAEAATTSAESTALSKALKKRGFAFVGPTTMYALMEALGIFDPHLGGCFRRGAG
ncbi:DNA-3-methyladenine glycosylase I [Nocardioides dongkuii]|uniref:DNA-3-methyladenine glycosylase I n=1 Tax=Nocardioides dongkuii TaxID=2760089 RepID=UPI0015FDE794|nr:DNA-3-methyladenine glycosylase I [Nocardioides dongkuii]